MNSTLTENNERGNQILLEFQKCLDLPAPFPMAREEAIQNRHEFVFNQMLYIV